MTVFTRLLVSLVVVTLTAGPALAAPLLVSRDQATRSAPSPATPTDGLVALLTGGLVVFGAIKIKDVGALAKKFVARSAQATPEYKSGVEQAGGDWETQTMANEANFEAGVQDAIGRKAFGKGVRKAGGAKYQKNASTLGATRYGPGVQNAEQAWATGTGPVLQLLAGLNLPPKGPRRSPQNMARSQMVAAALGAWKTGQ
jgi:hypothetical protein